MKKRILFPVLSILAILSIFFSYGGRLASAQSAQPNPGLPTPAPGNGSESGEPLPGDEEGDSIKSRLLNDRFRLDNFPRIGLPELFAPLVPLEGYSAPFKAVMVAGGLNYTCILTQEGGVKCWGDNTQGKLGDGTTVNRYRPVNVVGLSSGVVAISASYKHTCALTKNGGVKCWGNNYHGELGDTTTQYRTTPVIPDGLNGGVVAIAAGGFHTCALLATGGLKCWGANWHGQVGDGTTVQRLKPVNVVGMSENVKAVTLGKYHTCGLVLGGRVLCWGYNMNGQIGDNTQEQKITPTLVATLVKDVVEISAGGLHTCARMQNGSVRCWGANSEAQLGVGNQNVFLVPQTVAGGIIATGISGGGYFSCALGGGSVMFCWGNNWAGQLGDGTQIKKKSPVPVLGISGNIVSIDAGESHACVVTDDGKVRCWGSNSFGQIGTGASSLRLAPVGVKSIQGGMISISAGGLHACALTKGGGVKCWGNNEYGQLGDGTKISRLTPVNVVGLQSNVVAISAGDFHSCALTGSGAVKCWGDNESGQLGDGTRTNRATPVDAKGLFSGVTLLAAGDYHTCAWRNDGGSVKCWGYNHYGELGIDTNVDSLIPIDAADLWKVPIIALASGGSHTCALTGAGAMKCWGDNFAGKLGINNTVNAKVPTDVKGMSSGVKAISLGVNHTCALMNTGEARCWGSNGFGQVGDGSTIDRWLPQPLPGLANSVAAIEAGGFHTCALLVSGDVDCWGDNWMGQLGDGTTFPRATPAKVPGLTGQVNTLAGGYYFNCALMLDSSAKCWGSSDNGQVGDGIRPWALLPYEIPAQDLPTLKIDNSLGQPGSYFNITGSNFPPQSSASVMVNGVVLSQALTVDTSGKLSFCLNTSQAGEGHYGVWVISGGAMYISFGLVASSPLLPQSGSGPVLDVPAGIAFTRLLFMPQVNR